MHIWFLSLQDTWSIFSLRFLTVSGWGGEIQAFGEKKNKPPIGGNNYFNKINFVLIKNPPLQFQTTKNKIFAIFLSH